MSVEVARRFWEALAGSRELRGAGPAEDFGLFLYGVGNFLMNVAL